MHLSVASAPESALSHALQEQTSYRPVWLAHLLSDAADDVGQLGGRIYTAELGGRDNGVDKWVAPSPPAADTSTP